MSFLVVVGLVVAAFWTYCLINSYAADSPDDLVVPLGRDETVVLVERHFGATWARVDGPGDVNLVPPFRNQPPTLSVSVRERSPQQTEVCIWVSSATYWFLAMNGAQLARRKKGSLVRRLTTSASTQPPLRRVTPGRDQRSRA